METMQFSRRGFMKSAAALGVAAVAAPLGSVRAQGAARKFKAALIGCGGRGHGALGNLREAARLVGAELEILALADVFPEKARKLAQLHGVPVERCIMGYDAYRKVMDMPVDIVLLATTPNFRPLHLEAAVAAGKHVFMEKPVAVDPPGVRRILAAGAAAKQKGLSIVAGTQRRHQEGYLRMAKALQEGMMGAVVGGRVSWCMGHLGDRNRATGESDADYMIHNWLSFVQMCGDNICEQHVHNLDIANWVLGRPPVAAVGFGGRARRWTGNQFDFFSVDFDYGSDVHIHSMCRQIDGCYDGVWEQFAATKGMFWGGGVMKTHDGKKVTLPEVKMISGDPYVQEHADLLVSIMKNEALNEAQQVAHSTLTAILGRTAAYTGQQVRWNDLLERQDSPFYNLTLTPTAEDFEKGTVVAPKDNVFPIPGRGR